MRNGDELTPLVAVSHVSAYLGYSSVPAARHVLPAVAHDLK